MVCKSQKYIPIRKTQMIPLSLSAVFGRSNGINGGSETTAFNCNINLSNFCHSLPCELNLTAEGPEIGG